MPGVGEIDPEQGVEIGRQLQRLELERQQVLVAGIGMDFAVLVDLPPDPLRVQRRGRAGDDGEAAVADAGGALRFELAGATLPLVEPDAQAVSFAERAGQRFDPRRVVVVVTEEEIELAQRLLAGEVGRQQRFVAAALVELRQEPVFEIERARRRALFEPARGRGDERAAPLRHRMADGGAAGQFAVEAVEEDPRRLDMHGVPHRKHAADAGLDQARGDRAENQRFAERRAAAGFEDDERNPVLGEQVAEPVGGDEVGLRLAAAVVALLEAEGADLHLRQEGPVAVEMDDVVVVAGLLRRAQHFPEARERRRAAEVELDRFAERVDRR
ncbi:MAG: hypothetical protein CAPSK01_001956 [Candidatus Accumulibacter vicinus]|uniref:Uncharacterized protein n=1 Tax=Candidatus Accumulibacter vicinus TaxID=2954382 RepID=A0A084Y1G6_9PROT|nr:MAG: hypothetical protein CAPSK01_001956 [Candidatus Accumulibacter vicinus]